MSRNFLIISITSLLLFGIYAGHKYYRYYKEQIIKDEGHWHLTWRNPFALAYPWLFEDKIN